jgi:hypothetical protein
MNIRSLPTPVMLTLTQGWLNDSQLREEISAHPLGAAAYDNLRGSGTELAQSYGLRSQVDKELARLGELLQGHDGDFDRFVRALYYHLTALIEAAPTPELASEYRELRNFLFPGGLSLVQRSYMAESGATVQIEESISPEQLARLHGIRVADHTLGSLYQGWIAAGRALGEYELERIKLQAAISRQTPIQASTKRMRHRWIRAVRMIIDAMDAMSLPAEARNKFLDPLLKCLASTQRSPGSPQPQPQPGDIDPGDSDPGDSDIAIDVTDLDMELAAAELQVASEPGPDATMIAARTHADSPAIFTPSSES